MFNIKKIFLSNNHCDGNNVGPFSLIVDNVDSEIFEEVIREKEKEQKASFRRESFNYNIIFIYNKATKSLDILNIIVFNDFFHIDASNISEEYTAKIKLKILELIDFNENAIDKPLHYIISNVLTEIVTEFKRCNISKSKTHTYEELTSFITAKLYELFPLHNIDCYPVYNGQSKAYGQDWIISLYSKENGYSSEIRLPITIILSVDRSTKFYSLYNVKLSISEYLDKSLSDFEEEIHLKQIENGQIEKDRQNQEKLEKIESSKATISLLQKQIYTLNAKDILNETVDNIITASSYKLDDNQVELFKECNILLHSMQNYIETIFNLSKEI